MSDTDADEYDFHAAGWGLAVDDAAGELHLEHAESATTYRLDGDGNLTVPGENAGDGGHDIAALRDLQAALAAGLEDLGHSGTVDARTGGGQTSGCNIECDDSTGEVTIESQTGITLRAPSIDVESSGNANVVANGVLALKGSLVELN